MSNGTKKAAAAEALKPTDVFAAAAQAQDPVSSSSSSSESTSSSSSSSSSSELPPPPPAAVDDESAKVKQLERVKLVTEEFTQERNRYLAKYIQLQKDNVTFGKEDDPRSNTPEWHAYNCCRTMHAFFNPEDPDSNEEKSFIEWFTAEKQIGFYNKWFQLRSNKEYQKASSLLLNQCSKNLPVYRKHPPKATAPSASKRKISEVLAESSSSTAPPPEAVKEEQKPTAAAAAETSSGDANGVVVEENDASPLKKLCMQHPAFEKVVSNIHSNLVDFFQLSSSLSSSSSSNKMDLESGLQKTIADHRAREYLMTEQRNNMSEHISQLTQEVKECNVERTQLQIEKKAAEAQVATLMEKMKKLEEENKQLGEENKQLNDQINTDLYGACLL